MFYALGLQSRFLHFIQVFNSIIEMNLMCYYIKAFLLMQSHSQDTGLSMM